MRRRAEKKRLETLQVADAVFLADGYAGASISEIARRLGGSKQTDVGARHGAGGQAGAQQGQADRADDLDAWRSAKRPGVGPLETIAWAIECSVWRSGD